MRIIVGIGNPGSRYKNNRHNIGFQFLDYYAEKKSLKFKASKFDFYFAEGESDEHPFFLVKPSSYVNNSGLPVLAAVQNYGINLSDLLVIVDDINIPFNSIRLRKSGGEGGHNGLYSIIYHLKSEDFPRLRIGIGNNFTAGKQPEYVLSDFDKDELKGLKKIFEIGEILVSDFVEDGFEKMINSYSRIMKSENSN